jgi:hypothetical protein
MLPSRKFFFTAGVLVLHAQLLVSVVAADSYVTELSRKYFTDVTMVCDHPDLNVTARSDVTSLTWILPDGETADSTRRPDPSRFQMSGPRRDLQAYNLTALSINDDVFGDYLCVIVSNRSRITVVKWRLNVGGADFSELMETYQENAVAGAIAAASMIVAIGAMCLLWHFRYSNRQCKLKLDLEEMSADHIACLQASSGQPNQAYEAHDDTCESSPTVKSA